MHGFDQMVLDGILQAIPHIQPWHVGAGLFVLAAFRQILWVARKVVSIRAAALATGSALIYPYVDVAAIDVGDKGLAIGALALSAGVFLVTMPLFFAVNAPRLSPEASKIIAALDRLKVGDAHASRGTVVPLTGQGLCLHYPGYGIVPFPFAYFKVNEVNLEDLVASRAERKKIIKHALATRDRLVAEQKEKNKQVALAKLEPVYSPGVPGTMSSCHFVS